MQSTAGNVDAYLAALPDNSKAALKALRELCLRCLDDYEECMLVGSRERALTVAADEVLLV
jgi:hypothetical protein